MFFPPPTFLVGVCLKKKYPVIGCFLIFKIKRGLHAGETARSRALPPAWSLLEHVGDLVTFQISLQLPGNKCLCESGSPSILLVSYWRAVVVVVGGRSAQVSAELFLLGKEVLFDSFWPREHQRE